MKFLGKHWKGALQIVVRSEVHKAQSAPLWGTGQRLGPNRTTYEFLEQIKSDDQTATGDTHKQS